MSAVGSRLFLQYILPDEGFDGISRQVWSGTPWVADVWTGSGDNRRRHEMYLWCRERYGRESWPFGDDPIPGVWREGNATVFGWTWWGFDTEERMDEFVAAWPAPQGVDRVN